ncbi:MAG: hypothetical protein K2F64_00500, partial [Muribaculaceae bacterium]|nr:hypothetical protein [Muribaculaceae bacterium]
MIFINFVAVKIRRVKIHHEGTNILVVLFLTLAALNATVWLFMPTLVIPVVCSAISILLYSFVCNFFRCPKRVYRGERKGTVGSSV